MTEESVFYQRLKTEIQLSGKNFNQVERELGYPRNSLNNYKSNATEPSGNSISGTFGLLWSIFRLSHWKERKS
ncbi:hypothetical protein [Lactococcus lactis]|uniref:hypothetical protein n=1 Tax=Lactococcus lactis TaxID=1358 RepID=UPI00374FCDB5